MTIRQTILGSLLTLMAAAAALYLIAVVLDPDINDRPATIHYTDLRAGPLLIAKETP
jgi:hypothetical protein